MDFLLLEGANIWDVYQKYYKDSISEEEYKILALCDPTSKGENKGKYLPWIIKQYLNNYSSDERQDIRYIQHIAKSFNEQLDWYDKHRTLLPLEQQDISRLSEDALDDIYESYKDNLFSKRELRERITPVYSDEEWLIFTPSTWEEERILVWDMYGGASWCTAADSEHGKSYFNRYTANGDKLYVHVRLSDKALFQYSPQSHEFHDKENEQVELDDVELSQGVIDWYKQSEQIDIVEELEQNGNWDDYVVMSADGYELGYFRNGTLYDSNREEIDNGYWDNWNAIKMGKEAFMIEYGNETAYDIYRLIRGLEYPPAIRGVKNVTIIDDYIDTSNGEMGLILGIDKDGDFVCCNMDDWWENYTRGGGVTDYKHLGDSIYLLNYGDSQHFGIANWNNEDLEFVYGVIDPERIEIDSDMELVYFWEYERDYNNPLPNGDYNYVWKHKQISFYATEGNWEYVEDEDEETDDEDEYAESMAESINSKNIISEFQRITKQLDEIHKRNTPLIF